MHEIMSVLKAREATIAQKEDGGGFEMAVRQVTVRRSHSGAGVPLWWMISLCFALERLRRPRDFVARFSHRVRRERSYYVR